MISFKATGTLWQIEFFGKEDDTEFQKDLEAKTLDLISDYDQILSRFNPNSQLFKLNEHKSLKNPDSILLEALSLAQKIQDLTDGAFSPFIGLRLAQKGYGPLHTAPNTKFSAKLKIDLRPDLIQIPAGSQLDLGSFGKGLIVDHLAELYLSLGLRYFIINAGGDIYLTSNQSKPIEIHLEDPKTQKLTKTVSLKNQAICTSANNKRTWQGLNGTEVHIQTEHFQPAGSSSVDQNKSITVVHSSCMVADLITTVKFVAGQQFDSQLTKLFGPFQ